MTGKVVITHGNVEFCEAKPIGLVDEAKNPARARDRPRPASGLGM